MKKIRLLYIGILIMFSMSQVQAAVTPIPTYKIDVEQSKVYFGNIEMAEADFKTFIIFEKYGGYAKDKNHVYLAGVILPAIDPAQADYLGYGRLKDHKHVYLGNQIIPDADPDTYQVLAVRNNSSSYGKDKNVVYFWGEKIDGADASSFVVLSDDIGKDKNHVYYNKRIIAEADPVTFEMLNVDSKINVYGRRMQGYGYGKDKHHVYYCGEKIKGADVNSFKETTYGYAMDKKRVYYFGEVIKNANPKTFVQPPYEPIRL